MSEIPFRLETTDEHGDAALAWARREERVRITVRAGERRTAGHAISIVRIVRDGTRLTVKVALRTPPPDAMVAQVLTWPAQTVSIEARAVRGVHEALLVDVLGTELARITPRLPTS